MDPRRLAREIGLERRRLSEKQRTLITRPDRNRPDEALSIPLFGRPLTLGGRYTSRIDYQNNRLLDSDLDDQLRIDQILELDLFYPITENISVYLSGRIAWRGLVLAVHEEEENEWQFSRDESWIYLGNLLATPFSFQVGRQRFSDDREWWWDADLDSGRLHFDLRTFHAEVGVATEIARVSIDDDFIKPDEDDVLRILGSLHWEPAKNHQFGFFALHQNDNSSSHSVGTCDPTQTPSGCFDRRREDESDAQLTWLGMSTQGRWKLGRPGKLYYWMNVAGLFGSEIFYDFTGDDASRSVKAKNNNDVSGWGIDTWLTLQMKLPSQPRLTLGYAYGSGDPGMTKETDTGFRQTGLQDNSDKWLGVDNFRYYGELFDPELSNMHILTASLGFPLFRNSSIEFTYHHYRQAEAAPFLRDVRFKRDPNGLNRALGQEWGVILGIEEWDRWEFELTTSLFRTGQAFSPDEGQLSQRIFFQTRFNF